jgi:transcriptional regulator GlxA family with amidase domain
MPVIDKSRADSGLKVKEWPTRRVAVLALPGMNLTTLAGPMDVFTLASTLLSRSRKRHSPAYELQLLTKDGEPLATASGFPINGTTPLMQASLPIDTLLIVAGRDAALARIDPELLAWVVERTKDTRRVGSICAGAFVLAAAGVLDGRQATTHWQLADELARRYPQVRVDGDRIYTQDGSIWTSAGVSAGVHLALAMVEEDHGHALALEIARRMVLFMRRGAGQLQFSSQLAAQAADHQPIRDLIAWISEHLNEDLSVPALARRVGMSDRNFSRVFTQQVGSTPARFVAHLRTEAAKLKMAESGEKLEAIAESAGFGDGETLRRHLRDEAAELPQTSRARASVAS